MRMTMFLRCSPSFLLIYLPRGLGLGSSSGVDVEYPIAEAHHGFGKRCAQGPEGGLDSGMQMIEHWKSR